MQRCGQIDGWKRVKDASGKLQGIIIRLLTLLEYDRNYYVIYLCYDQHLVFVNNGPRCFRGQRPEAGVFFFSPTFVLFGSIRV